MAKLDVINNKSVFCQEIPLWRNIIMSIYMEPFAPM
jgi:hypothetical protein